jgi:hypothetical protein
MDPMTPEKDTFRIELRNAKLCMELDCNTVFDAVTYRHCPTCSSAEFYPLESWLNRDRRERREPTVREARTTVHAAISALPRPLWLDRLYVPRGSESELAGASVRPRRGAQRRRAG